ncbi:hypothetical protein MRX96_002808 [Rhipicephalus microplus]
MLGILSYSVREYLQHPPPGKLDGIRYGSIYQRCAGPVSAKTAPAPSFQWEHFARDLSPELSGCRRHFLFSIAVDAIPAAASGARRDLQTLRPARPPGIAEARNPRKKTINRTHKRKHAGNSSALVRPNWRWLMRPARSTLSLPTSVQAAISFRSDTGHNAPAGSDVAAASISPGDRCLFAREVERKRRTRSPTRGNDVVVVITSFYRRGARRATSSMTLTEPKGGVVRTRPYGRGAHNGARRRRP